MTMMSRTKYLYFLFQNYRKNIAFLLDLKAQKVKIYISLCNRVSSLSVSEIAIKKHSVYASSFAARAAQRYTHHQMHLSQLPTFSSRSWAIYPRRATSASPTGPSLRAKTGQNLSGSVIVLTKLDRRCSRPRQNDTDTVRGKKRNVNTSVTNSD